MKSSTFQLHLYIDSKYMQLDTSVDSKDAGEEKNDECIALCPYNGAEVPFS